MRENELALGTQHSCTAVEEKCNFRAEGAAPAHCSNAHTESEIRWRNCEEEELSSSCIVQRLHCLEVREHNVVDGGACLVGILGVIVAHEDEEERFSRAEALAVLLGRIGGLLEEVGSRALGQTDVRDSAAGLAATPWVGDCITISMSAHVIVLSTHY